MTAINKRLLIRGIVQGVGFRPTVYSYAQKHGLKGWVLNNAHGVEIEMHGEDKSIEAFIKELQDKPPSMAQIDNFEVFDLPFHQFEDFTIIDSQDDSTEFLPVSPDLKLCSDCQRELFDPADRRFRYPFINCTNCGPRFSIVRKIPYDRPNTSMANFQLCPACETEYHNPTDRRFHAQPVACSDCGPQIWLQTKDKHLAEKEEALQLSRKLIREGKILAVKGLGGFHLTCDAQNQAAVERLRERKGRSGKAFVFKPGSNRHPQADCKGRGAG